MDVDYATVNRNGSVKVRDAIMGKTVKVTGVSGQFRDNLLLIRKGQTLIVRTGGYSFENQTLSFAHKFNVLERSVPFSPDAHGVPPETFRGFAGTLKGKILESGGYELLMLVDEVVSVADANKATAPKSIMGKRIRVSGFTMTIPTNLTAFCRTTSSASGCFIAIRTSTCLKSPMCWKFWSHKSST